MRGGEGVRGRGGGEEGSGDEMIRGRGEWRLDG